MVFPDLVITIPLALFHIVEKWRSLNMALKMLVSAATAFLVALLVTLLMILSLPAVFFLL